VGRQLPKGFSFTKNHSRYRPDIAIGYGRTGRPSFIIVNLSNLAYFTFVFNSFSDLQ
jgi:hypothetical protein